MPNKFLTALKHVDEAKAIYEIFFQPFFSPILTSIGGKKAERDRIRPYAKRVVVSMMNGTYEPYSRADARASDGTQLSVLRTKKERVLEHITQIQRHNFPPGLVVPNAYHRGDNAVWDDLGDFFADIAGFYGHKKIVTGEAKTEISLGAATLKKAELVMLSELHKMNSMTFEEWVTYMELIRSNKLEETLRYYKREFFERYTLHTPRVRAMIRRFADASSEYTTAILNESADEWRAIGRETANIGRYSLRQLLWIVGAITALIILGGVVGSFGWPVVVGILGVVALLLPILLFVLFGERIWRGGVNSAPHVREIGRNVRSTHRIRESRRGVDAHINMFNRGGRPQ